MKRVLTIILLATSASAALAQDSLLLLSCPCRVELRNRTDLAVDSILEVHAGWIVYEKDGSLHDLLLGDVAQIRSGNAVIWSAQEEEPDTGTAPALPVPFSLLVKTNPLSVLEPEPSVQAGLEFRTGRRWSVEQDIGFLFSGPFTDDRIAGGSFLSRTELRHYYVSRQGKSRRYIAEDYVALRLLYKSVFYQDAPVSEKRVLGIALLVGSQRIFDRSKASLDLFAGFGVRGREVLRNERAPYPDGVPITRELRTGMSVPFISAGVRLGLRAG